MKFIFIPNYIKVLVYLINNPLYLLLFLSAKLKNAKLCAFFLYCSIKVKTIKTKNKKYQYLILNKSVFQEDIESIFTNLKANKLLFLGRTYLHFIAKAFFKKNVNDNNYHDQNSNDAIKNYRDFLDIIVFELEKYYKLNGVFSGNFSYFEERELAYVLEKRKIPFIVIHKECFKTKGRIKEYEKLYRSNKGPFWGALILVYNNIEKQLIVKSGVTTCNKVKVVGMPRLDEMFSLTDNFNQHLNKDITLISFHKDLNSLDEKTLQNIEQFKKPNLSNLWWDLHTLFFEMAIDFPNIQFNIKTKGNFNDIFWMKELLKKNRKFQNISNIKIIHGGPIKEIIKKSYMICGIHSTALLEAIAANKKILILKNSETHKYSEHLIDFGNTVSYSRNKVDIRNKIYAFIKNKKISINKCSNDKKKLLKHWLGNSDGNASKRARKEILKILKKYRQKPCVHA